MFESGSTSVLAVLLSPIRVDKIQKRIEKHFLSASRRAVGLMILSKLMCLPVPAEVQLDLSNWFTSSLREKTNNLVHYIDNIKSCGNHLEGLVRQNFFNNLISILDKIR
jgi:hypothetical protein